MAWGVGRGGFPSVLNRKPVARPLMSHFAGITHTQCVTWEPRGIVYCPDQSLKVFSVFILFLTEEVGYGIGQYIAQ